MASKLNFVCEQFLPCVATVRISHAADAIAHNSNLSTHLIQNGAALRIPSAAVSVEARRFCPKPVIFWMHGFDYNKYYH